MFSLPRESRFSKPVEVGIRGDCAASKKMVLGAFEQMRKLMALGSSTNKRGGKKRKQGAHGSMNAYQRSNGSRLPPVKLGRNR